MIIIEFKREMGDFEICNEHEKHLGERGEEYGVGRDEGSFEMFPHSVYKPS